VTTFNSDVTRQLLDIAVTKGRIYAAEAGNNGGGIAAVNRKTGKAVWEEKRLDGDVQAITTIGSTVYVGGHFKSICPDDVQNASGKCLSDGQERRERTAAYDRDGNLLPWTVPMDSDIGVRAFHVIEDRLLVGGDFTTSNGVASGRLAVFR
jgi:outer membrane protein assembly factor BamB